jgi:hypothetical protein
MIATGNSHCRHSDASDVWVTGAGATMFGMAVARRRDDLVAGAFLRLLRVSPTHDAENMDQEGRHI